MIPPLWAMELSGIPLGMPLELVERRFGQPKGTIMRLVKEGEAQVRDLSRARGICAEINALPPRRRRDP